MSQVASMLPDERRRLIAEQLKEHGSVSVTSVGERFGVSLMTVRRDLTELERQGVARRTHGGAVLPGPSSHEDAFAQRLEVAVEAKERLAAAAVALIAPGEAVFVDSSTTSYFAARRLVRDKLRCTVLTNSVPVMELISRSELPGTELIGLSGSLRKATRSFVGPATIEAIARHFADKALFSVNGVAPGGIMTEADPLEAEVKRQMLARSRCSILLLDGSKFERAGLSAIAEIKSVAKVLVAHATAAHVEQLTSAGVEVEEVR